MKLCNFLHYLKMRHNHLILTPHKLFHIGRPVWKSQQTFAHFVVLGGILNKNVLNRLDVNWMLEDHVQKSDNFFSLNFTMHVHQLNWNIRILQSKLDIRRGIIVIDDQRSRILKSRPRHFIIG